MCVVCVCVWCVCVWWGGRLWVSTNAAASSPTFVRDTRYDFSHPARVHFNPFDTNEVWATSFGGGLRKLDLGS